MGSTIALTNQCRSILCRLTIPSVKNAMIIGAAEYFVYRQNIANAPAIRKSFVLLPCKAFRKRNTEPVEKNVNVASLRPDCEKNKKYSLVTKNATAYRPISSLYSILPKRYNRRIVRQENTVETSIMRKSRTPNSAKARAITN